MRFQRFFGVTVSAGYHHPMQVPSQYINPSAELDRMPYRITGPAIVNILAPTPNTWPSFLNSIAAAATELANPVIGTSSPAPANLVILGYSPAAVSRTEINISIREHHVDALVLSRCQ